MFSSSERIVGTNGRGNMVLLGTSATLTTFEMREPFYIGVDTPYIQIALDNWGIGATGADVLPPTDITISEVAVEKASATSPVLFSGSRSVVIAPGETKLSDRLYASDFGLSRFTRGDLIWVRKRGTVPTNGQMFDGAQVAAYSANGCFATRFDATVGSNNVSQVDATGAMSAKTGQADFGAGINTTCILGLPLDPRIPSIYAQGTSIDQASIDSGVTTLLGGAGWIMRAMFAAANTKPIPVLNHARPGSSLGNGMSLTRRSFYYRYATVAIDGHGTGDIQQSGAGDITTFKANELTQWAAFRTAGIASIIKPKVIPRNQSSDLWATLANQSQTAAFDTQAQDINDWIDAQLSGGLLDHVLSQNVTRYDTGSNYWKWPTDESTAKWSCEDGTHPVARMHALMATDLRTLLGQQFPYAV